MEARIYVGWPDGYFLTTAGPNSEFQAELAAMVEDLGPPSVVEFRAADEGYLVEESYDDATWDSRDVDLNDV
jgi:hypothetical protein